MKAIVSINIMVSCEVDMQEHGVFLRTTKDPSIVGCTIHDTPIEGDLRESTDRMITSLILREVGKKVTFPEGTELQWVNRDADDNGDPN